MDAALILLVAFALGFAARAARLPPMVGFLAAGFVLARLGVPHHPTITTLAELGVTLMMFAIGLKLRLSELARPMVWAGAVLHMAVTSAVVGLVVYALGASSLQSVPAMSLPTALLVGFALSFSSTVFAVKVLDDRGESRTLHGLLAVGILVMQDVLAVGFLTASTGKLPSPWALALVLLVVPGRLVVHWLVQRVGHGELLTLLGLVLALVLGADLFSLVDLKADLGALILGVVAGGHPKSKELYEGLADLKEILLVGFFLEVGLSGTLGLAAFELAAVFLLLLPLKLALYHLVLVTFRLRARTAFLSTLTLANYSEFGLIVAGVAAKNGWLGDVWLSAVAIALSASFVAAAAMNNASQAIYRRFSGVLRRLESPHRLSDEAPIALPDADVVVLGMGRVGTRCYDELAARYPGRVVGIELDAARVQAHLDAGRAVLQGDAADDDFWERARPARPLRAVLVATTHPGASLEVVQTMRAQGYDGFVAAVAAHDDEEAELVAAGANSVHNVYEHAGIGLLGAVPGELDLAEPGPQIGDGSLSVLPLRPRRSSAVPRPPGSRPSAAHPRSAPVRSAAAEPSSEAAPSDAPALPRPPVGPSGE